MPPSYRRASFGNILVRKAFRHARITTLFPNFSAGGVIATPVSARYPRQSSSSTEKVVQASLASTPPDFPGGEILPPAQESVSFEPVQKQSIKTADAPSRAAPSRTERPISASSTPIQSRLSSSPGLDDRTWHNLQSIFRRHQEIEANAGSTPVSEEASFRVPIKPEAAAQPPATVQRRTDISQDSADQVPLEGSKQVQSIPAPVPYASSRNDSAITDGDWLRLQAISRAHREKAQETAETHIPAALVEQVHRTPDTIVQAAAAEPPAKETSALKEFPLVSERPVHESQENTVPLQQASRPEPILGKSQMVPGERVPVLQRIRNFFRKEPAHTETSVLSEMPQPEVIRAEGSEVQMDTAVDIKSSLAREEETRPPVGHPDQLETIQLKPAARENLPLVSNPTVKQPSAHSKMIEMPGVEPAGGSAYQTEDAIDSLEGEFSEDSSQIPTQALPLQAIWAVEKQAPDYEETTASKPTKVESEPVEIQPEKHLEIQRILQEVQPGQSTDSSVEVITPRKPRPQYQPAPKLPEIENLKGTPTDSRTLQVIQTQPQPESFAKQGATIQRKGLEMVDTPAGPMPLELLKHITGSGPLEIVGPEENLHLAPMEMQALTGNDRSMPASPVPERPVPHMSESTPHPQKSPAESPLIQRMDSASPDGGPAVDDTEAQPDSETPAGTGQPDIDELSRKVYAEVKRKLAVEWERMRR